MQITLTIPDDIYEEVEAVAERQNRSVEEILTETINQTFEPFPLDENHAQMAQEMESYKKIHPELWGKYPREFVAVMGGQVIDHDSDLTKLAIRIEENYPDRVVLLEEVLATLPPVLYMRSPRFI